MRYKNKTEAVKSCLERKGRITTWEAIEKYGATRLSAIIFNLRKKGYDIKSISKRKRDRYGNYCPFVEYRLLPHEENHKIK